MSEKTGIQWTDHTFNSLTWLEGCAQTLLDEIEALRGARPSPPPASLDRAWYDAVEGLCARIAAEHGTTDHAWLVRCSLDILKELRQGFSPPPATPQEPRDSFPPRTVCFWTLDDWRDGESWETACGHKFEFTTDGPKENGAEFCCYCGGLLREIRPTASHGADTPGQETK